MSDPFKWRQYEGDIILICVRWYLRYALSYRDLAEMMTERGLSVDHSTIFRWVQDYAPEIEKRIRPNLKQTNDSWRVDETYIKVRGKWIYLYRAVDSTGQTLDFLLNETRSTRAAKRFFRKVLGRSNITAPRVINVDKNRTYIGAIRSLKREKLLPDHCKRRPNRYMHNMVEQDHRFMTRLIWPGLGFGSYPTAWRTILGYETMHMIRKGQIEGIEKGDIRAQNRFIALISLLQRIRCNGARQRFLPSLTTTMTPWPSLSSGPIRASHSSFKPWSYLGRHVLDNSMNGTP